jgi:hypothetical protein
MPRPAQEVEIHQAHLRLAPAPCQARHRKQYRKNQHDASDRRSSFLPSPDQVSHPNTPTQTTAIIAFSSVILIFAF